MIATFGTTAARAQDVMGVWNVVSKPNVATTCGVKTANSAYQWVVSRNGSAISIKVLGTTSFPVLEGRVLEETADRSGNMTGVSFVVHGSGSSPLGSGVAGVYPGSVFRVTTNNNTLKGTRYYLGSVPRAGGGTVLCVDEYDVSGTKQ